MSRFLRKAREGDQKVVEGKRGEEEGIRTTDQTLCQARRLQETTPGARDRLMNWRQQQQLSLKPQQRAVSCSSFETKPMMRLHALTALKQALSFFDFSLCAL